MKKIFIVFLLLMPFFSNGQTLSFLNRSESGSWQNFTILASPLKPDSSEIFYISNTSLKPLLVHELKSSEKDGVTASLVTIGDEKTQYLLIFDMKSKRLIFTDDKQRLTTLFDLDSKLFNPDVQHSNSYGDTAKLLLNAFKFLLL